MKEMMIGLTLVILAFFAMVAYGTLLGGDTFTVMSDLIGLADSDTAKACADCVFATR